MQVFPIKFLNEVGVQINSHISSSATRSSIYRQIKREFEAYIAAVDLGVSGTLNDYLVKNWWIYCT